MLPQLVQHIQGVGPLDMLGYIAPGKQELSQKAENNDNWKTYKVLDNERSEKMEFKFNSLYSS